MERLKKLNILLVATSAIAVTVFMGIWAWPGVAAAAGLIGALLALGAVVEAAIEYGAVADLRRSAAKAVIGVSLMVAGLNITSGGPPELSLAAVIAGLGAVAVHARTLREVPS
jgi:hypothetical protein